MMRRGSGISRLRLSKKKLVVGLALLALVISSVSVTTFVIRSAAATPSQQVPRQQHNNPRDAAQYMQLRHYGKNLPQPDARAKALEQAKALPQYPMRRGAGASTKSTASPLSSDPTASWTPLGPQPVDSTSCFDPDPLLDNCFGPYGDNEGRVTALAVHPTDSDNLWVGTADGGLWHSTDGGVHYTPVSDSWPTMAIGSVAVDPISSATIYVGTGEGNQNSDAYWGAGVFVSTDNGMSWSQFGFKQFGGMSITKLSVDPFHGNTLLAAVTYSNSNTPPGGASSFTTNGGIWRSPDGGFSWTQVLKDSSSMKLDYGTDVIFDPAHEGVAYASIANPFGAANSGSFTSVAGVYKSVDGGVHWTRLSSGIPTGGSINRISLGLSGNGQTLYAAMAAQDGTLLNHSIYRSTNISTGSPTFTAIDVSGVDGGAMADGNSLYWYNLVAAVDPTNSQVAYIGGIDIYQTTNGGTSWTNLTDAYGTAAAHVQPDQHALAFFSSGSPDYYVGNDGGIWKYSSSGGTFTNLNDGGLNTVQFYGGSYGEVGGGSGMLYGGSQSNGVLRYTGTALDGPTTWNEVVSVGGAAGYTVVDYTDNHIIYSELPGVGIIMSTNDGALWRLVNTRIDPADDVNFIPPLIMSPTTHTTLYTGTTRVYHATGSPPTWVAISPNLDGTPISALAVAPNNENVIYAGTNGGKIFHTTNGGVGTWPGGSIPGSTGGVLTGIAVDPTTASTVYATFANFAGSAGHHVFKSTDSGTHWTDISASLPNIPFESILVNPQYSGLVIAGSDAGVFASTNGGGSWFALGEGLPNVAINQLFASHDGSKLFVATHGRGMWELSTASLLVTPTTPMTATVGVNSGGGTYDAGTVTVTNAGFTSMSWAVDTSGLPTCLSFAPSSGSLAPGAHTNVAISVDTTAPGTCAAKVSFTANGLVPSVTIPVAVEVSNLSTTWYFAEGYTGKGFDEWLTLANPGGSSASVQVTYLIQGSSTPLVKTYTVNPKSRFTVKVNAEIGSTKSNSMVVTSTVPIIAERPMYVLYGLNGSTIPGGTSLMGTTSLGTDYDFGYVDTTPNHDTWFTILNQNDFQLDVTIDYFNGTTGAKTTVTSHHVPPHSRSSIKVNDEGLPVGAYSAHVHFSAFGQGQPGLVERPMYFKDASTGRPGITDVLGVSSPQTAWYFAEGQQDSTHRELFVLSNPSESDPVTAHVQIFGSDTSDFTSPAYMIQPGEQVIVDASTIVGTGAASHGARVFADGPILADRYISQRFVGKLGTSNSTSTVDGATDSTGTSVLGQAYYFAEGYTGGKSAEFLELVNPDATHDATVTVSYLPSNGSAAKVVVYPVPAHSQLRITTSTVMKGTSFSLAVLSDRGIVAERTMEFIYGLPTGTTTTNVPGANVAVGYQP